jgi:hypothetical protein
MPEQPNARKEHKAEPDEEPNARETSPRTRAELGHHRRGDRLDEVALGQFVLASGVIGAEEFAASGRA